MILYLLAYLGGVLTIVSPCILPVIPFVFARADRPFLTNGLPMLAGMALMFAGVATLAAVGGGWVVSANQYGRTAALVVLALFGLTLLFPALADRAMQPLVAVGSRLSNRADAGSAGIGTSLLLGIATGLLWAPCAGPILGLLLTGAALQGATATTTALLLAYALGAATSLALVLLVGGRLFRAMKRSLGAGQWIRRAIGAVVLVAVAAIALGADTGFLTRASVADTSSIEDRLLAQFGQRDRMKEVARGGRLGDEGPMPPLAGATAWLNASPLKPQDLRGKVVLVDFWTYSCINCLRSIPYVRAWAEKYRAQGLVVIGVHTPEFAFERDIGNVRRAAAGLGISYPVAIDNDHAIWRAFRNNYWPAHYFIDGEGRIRHHHFGEGDYAESERVIQALLAEAHPGTVAKGVVTVAESGAEAAAGGDVGSPETYIGYARGDRFASPGGYVRDAPADYRSGPAALNAWSLEGRWTVAPQFATAAAAGARIHYRFHARDLHLVLGSAGGPVRFRILIDGRPPGADHGSDTDAAGNGAVHDHRLYQLVRQHGPIADRDFTIEFLDPGVQAFAFTFG